MLLIFLLKGVLPERYADRVRVNEHLRGLDMSRLPDALISRIAKGENVNAVLAGAVADGLNPRTFLKEPLVLRAALDENVDQR